MQLDVVKAETVGIHQDVFLTFVDKDADALGAGWQITFLRHPPADALHRSTPNGLCRRKT